MSALSSSCLRSGSCAWGHRPEDRYCGLCGRRLVAVVPRLPLLWPGPPPVVAAYLWIDDGAADRRLCGQLTFNVVGAAGDAPAVLWESTGAPRLRESADFTPPATLRVQLDGDARGPHPVPFGEGRLTVRVRGESFPFVVRAFAVGREAERPWLSLARGERPKGTELAIFRGAGRLRTYLHCRLGDGIPAQWERVECDHPAVTVRPLGKDGPTPLLVVAVDWDPSGLPTDDRREKVSFRLHLIGLGERVVPFTQGVRWRQALPLRCRPVGLLLPLLAEGRPSLHAVEVSNAERQPVRLLRVESAVPWVTVADVLPGLPLRLGPGENAKLWLEVRPESLPDGYGPHVGRVTFVLAGLGPQKYPVVVEEVRRIRPLDGPLLVDPGPPSLVLARLDANGLITFRAAPSFPAAETARAACTGEGAAALVARMVKAAIDAARTEEQYEARDVLLCRQPWVPAGAVVPGARAIDWVRLALDQAAALDEPASLVIRLDAWATYVVPLGEGAAPRRTWQLAEAIGAGALRALMAGLGRPAGDADRLTDQLRAELAAPAGAGPSRLGLLLAVEGLLRDYRWGPDYAWRQALAAAWDSVPELPGGELRPVVAHAALREELRRYVARLLGLPGQRGGRCLWLSPLFAGPDFAADIQSASQPQGIAAACLAAGWLEWLGRFAAGAREPPPFALPPP